jgi:hypothetical protein
LKIAKTYLAIGLTLIFCIYYAGISMFSHTHIVNGSSVVHSHLGGGEEHSHSESQYAVIDILTDFQSECAAISYGIATPFFQLSESLTAHHTPFHLSEEGTVHSLRGPPQA